MSPRRRRQGHVSVAKGSPEGRQRLNSVAAQAEDREERGLLKRTEGEQDTGFDRTLGSTEVEQDTGL